jgi:hypothetical protein
MNSVMIRFAVLVGERVFEIAQPDGEARRLVEPFEQRFALLRAHVDGLSRVGDVHEAAFGLATLGEDVAVPRADPPHFLGVDGTVVERGTPVRAALENREVRGGLGHDRDQLHGRSAGADHRDPLALEVHRLVRPEPSMVGLALEAIDALDLWHDRRGKRAHCGDEVTAPGLTAIFRLDDPLVVRIVESRRCDAAVELDVSPQIELVRDVLTVAQRVRLRREQLLPIPFVEQLLGERVNVGVTLRIEAAAGVAVPIPRAADVACGIEDAHREAELPQADQLVQAVDAGADDDGIVALDRHGRR